MINNRPSPKGFPSGSITVTNLPASAHGREIGPEHGLENGGIEAKKPLDLAHGAGPLFLPGGGGGPSAVVIWICGGVGALGRWRHGGGEEKDQE